MSASMRSTLQTVPESVPADHVTNSKKISLLSKLRCGRESSEGEDPLFLTATEFSRSNIATIILDQDERKKD
uniref:Uncharacterized protein n=1 Tax=Vespula pensylvanica TaxID=30213 RepID=A0A834U9Y1_VESPE|nr:hypothetical protein H0235_007564 [Vespula pensylvanica]